MKREKVKGKNLIDEESMKVGMDCENHDEKGLHMMGQRSLGESTLQQSE